VTPASAGWQYLSFRVVALAAGQSYTIDTGGEEMALVPCRAAVVQVGGEEFHPSAQRRLCWPAVARLCAAGPDDPGHGTDGLRVRRRRRAGDGQIWRAADPPEEIKCEIRGGGAARRQVNHILAPPLAAERLILFEVYVPGGSWSGWPPHCHDGSGGSPYLEETYYYRIDPPDGFAIHRNYRLDTDFDELLPVRSGDLVLVTQGYHPVAAAPGSNVYFLNYLAGDLLDEERARPPLDDVHYAWMKENWEGNRIELPIAR
jgi:5-deoxy-glucuronate isomerase